MKSKLYVSLEIKLSPEVKEELEKIGAIIINGNEAIIPIEKLKDAEKIVNQKIIVPKKDIDFLMKLLKETDTQVVVGDTFHKAFFGFEAQLKDMQDYYVLYIPHTGQEYKIPKEVVMAYIRVISLLKKKGIKVFKKRNLVSMVFRELGLFKTYEKNGSFHWEAFYGDRKNYHIYYYGPIKIIEKWKLIRVLPSDKIEIL